MANAFASSKKPWNTVHNPIFCTTQVGKDDFGDELVLMMNKERVQMRAVKFDLTAKTYMKIKFDDERMWAEMVKESAEDSLLCSELNLAVLKEGSDFRTFVLLFGMNSYVVEKGSFDISLNVTDLIQSNVLFQKVWRSWFFDVNLSLPLWKSHDETRKYIDSAWNEADIIEVSRQELEFLLDEDNYVRKRNYRPQYYAEEFEQTKKRRDYYHYTPEEISSLWHKGLRTGSGDAVVAAIMRKLTTHPEMYEDQDVFERKLRFAVAAGIISQWTIGNVRGFPTESATQNLKEQVYVPSMW
ncbi:hypothetical protein C1H46_008830 [Malus baccata]|uniref:Cyclic nucleotide-binding domain-containing protein n=1 Tax=Malus baccata TaxID=106549 RepID=A0A540N4W6_MALBA|nr:hypothetical protein C1H46_008830 [Malus baccata]